MTVNEWQARHELYRQAKEAGCPADQIRNFEAAGYFPQPKQLQFHAACRLCDWEDGPDQIGFGGARGPGKSHAAFAQLALDDCRRIPGLKSLYVRKVGKQAKEQFEDLRRSVLAGVQHKYDRSTGEVRIWDDSRIIIGNFNTESDIDKYLGLEYDIIVLEESTMLTGAKFQALRDSNRTSKDFEPRIYTTTNPGNVGHGWYKALFIEPYRTGQEQRTRFVPATVYDNLHIDRGYVRKLEGNVGWKRRAYLLGDWDIAAGQYFTSWRHDRHVVPGFEISAGWWSWLAMDYGYRHPTVFVLLVEDGDGMLYVVDEHVQDGWLPARHADAVRSMLSRHGMGEETLAGVPAGQDVFSKTGENTIAEQYEAAGVYLEPADVDRINGAARLAELLGDPDNGIEPRIQFFERCRRTIETIPLMQHDPRRPEDVLKVDVGEDGQGGDDCYDALRYGVMTPTRREISGLSAAPADALEIADRGGF